MNVQDVSCMSSEYPSSKPFGILESLEPKAFVLKAKGFP